MSAKPQVTITLGRSGQVVKRAGPIADGSYSDYGSSAGGKRPIRERLRNNIDGYGGLPQSKRQRRENSHWSSGGDDMNDDNRYISNSQIGQNDLRFKLMRKHLPRQMNLDSRMNVDLRERLSRSAQRPLWSDARRNHIESRTHRVQARIPPTRSADDLLHMNSRRSFSPSPSNRFRHRSPDRFVSNSRGFSSLRNYDGLRQRSSISSLDSSRQSFMGKVSDFPRTATFTAKAPYPVEPSKPAMIIPPSNGTMKGSYAIEEPTTVSGLLHSLGLGKYAILFQAEEVDMAALKQMGDNDLKELGIPMGPRKKILLALVPRAKQQRRS